MNKSWVRYLLAGVAGLSLAVLAGYYWTFHSLSYREVIVILVALVGVVTFLLGERGVRIGFFLWVWTLGLGYRTVEVTDYLKIHPSEVLLWGLLVLLILQRAVLDREVEGWLPPWLWLFIPFWIWGWKAVFWDGRPWDKMFTEFKNFLLLIPLFVVAKKTLRDKEGWRYILPAFYATGAWIAGMGVLEYLFPQVRYLFPGYISAQTSALTAQRFVRAMYTFWGSPAATFVCALSLPMILVLWMWYDRLEPRLLLLAAFALQLFGIYIGGYRSMWLITALEFSAFLWLKQGFIPGALLTGSMLFGLSRLRAHSSEQTRLDSLLLALQGEFVDSSIAGRWDRIVGTVKAVLRRPLGWGWAGVGWSHSDFLQVAANLSVLAGLLFLAAYLMTLWRAWRLTQQHAPSSDQGALAWSLFISFGAAGGILAVQGVEVLPQLVLPVWLVWVLTELWIRRHTESSGEDNLV